MIRMKTSFCRKWVVYYTLIEDITISFLLFQVTIEYFQLLQTVSAPVPVQVSHVLYSRSGLSGLGEIDGLHGTHA